MPWSRRAFVKGCVAASGAAALAAGATWQFVAPAPQRVEYVGATRIYGPATRGVPLFPLRADASGQLFVNPAPPGWERALDWYKYCSRVEADTVQPWYRPKDEYVRYFQTQEKLANPEREAPWYRDRLGQVPRVADFTALGQGAPVAWRSDGQQGKNVLLGLVIKLDTQALQFDHVDARRVRAELMVPTPDGGVLVAYHAACPHFCCSMDWHESPIARPMGMWDTIFCDCHLVACDPLRITSDFFIRDA